MAFDKAEARIPVAVRDLSITLVDHSEVSDRAAYQSARYSVQVGYDNGDIEVMNGDLVPHITTAQIEALQAFIAGLRVQAAAEILS